MVQIFKNKQNAKRDENGHEEDTSDEESDEKKLVDSLSASVRCPICLDPIVTKAPNVLTSGIFLSYFLLSNFFRHLKMHLKENKTVPKRKLRDRNSATGQKTIVRKVKRLKSDSVLPKVKPSTKAAKSSNRIQEDSSSDSDENSELCRLNSHLRLRMQNRCKAILLIQRILFHQT